MSSTFALPTTFLGSVRRARLRRDAVAVEASAIEQHPAAAAASGDGDRRAALPFLRTPSSWHVGATRPVSYLDHVAVAPAAVLAITSRFHAAVDDDEHVARAWRDIRTAKGAAKLLELTLGDADSPAGVEVRPVLVLWGPGAPTLENGYLLVKGVWILDPSRPETWAHLFDIAVIDDARQAALVDTLRDLQVGSNDAPIALAG